MSKAKSLLNQTLIYGLSYIFARVLNFLLTPFYTRIFTNTADFGIVTELYAYITFFNVLYSYGMETAYFYFKNREKENTSVAGTAFLSLLISGVFFSGILYIFSNDIANLLHYPDKTVLIKLSALILFWDTLAIIPYAYLREQNKSIAFSMIKLLSVLVTILLNIAFIVIIPDMKGYTINGAMAVEKVFLANVWGSFISFAVLIPFFYKVSWKIDTVLLKKMILYGLPLLVAGLAGMVNETIDRLLLKFYLLKPPISMTMEEALKAVGVYGACYKLSIFITLAVQAFRFAAEPFFFKELKEKDSKKLYATIFEYFTIIISLIFVVVVCYLPLLILILGERYRGGYEVIPILLGANLFLSLYYYLSQWYKQTGKTIYGTYISLIGAVITILMNIVLIPIIGYLGSAWATLLCYGVMAGLSYYYSRKHYPVPFKMDKIVWYLFSSFITVSISYVLHQLMRSNSLGIEIAVQSILIILYLGIIINEEKIDLKQIKWKI